MLYNIFARYYDVLTANIDYRARAAYFDAIIAQAGGTHGLLLDAGCGTGSLSFALADLGYDVIGTDPSEEMLAQAMRKNYERERQLMFLCQPMEALDLYGTVDAAVCALDTVNHITDEKILAAGFARVALFLAPGGIFIFDVNTPYKHRVLLRDQTYVYDLDEVYCVWQNSYRPEHDTVDIQLDFFEPQTGNKYSRSSERFQERIYSHNFLTARLEENGLDVLAVYGDDAFAAPGPEAQRHIYVAKKREE